MLMQLDTSKNKSNSFNDRRHKKSEAQHLTALNILFCLFSAISDLSLKFIIFRHMKAACAKDIILVFSFIVMNFGLLFQSEILFLICIAEKIEGKKNNCLKTCSCHPLLHV